MERSVLIAIPAFNEAASIKHVINSVIKHGDVYVFDNNSSDLTSKIAKENGASVYSVIDKGYENVVFSIVDYFEESNYIKLILIDGDGEVGLNKIEESINLLDKFDVVVGNRDQKKRIGEKIICYLFDYFFNIKDIYCGFKSFKKSGINKNRTKNTFATSVVNKKTKIFNMSVNVEKRLSSSKLGEGFSINFDLILSGIRGLLS